ncbi:MAG: hypothetical protein V3U24_05600 [Candidatus Neomarinimicrobiota bacterium]
MSLEKDLILTIITALVSVLGIFLLNGYVARLHGLETLGEYLLVRRTSYAIVGLLLLGMNIGLPRFIARDPKGRFGNSAVVTFAIFTIPAIGLLFFLFRANAVPGFIPEHAGPYAIFITGVCCQALTYGLYRGHLNMLGASILRLLGSILVPISVFLVVREIPVILSSIGLAVFLLSMGSFYLRNDGLISMNVEWHETKRLWRYGFERIPSFVSQFFLLAGVPLLLAYYIPYSELAYVNSSISLVRMFLLVVGPLGVVLLPRISRALAEGRREEVTRGVELLVTGALFFGTVTAISLSLSGPAILKLWLGSVSTEGAKTVTVILLALPFYAIVGILRNPIDAVSVRGYNSIIFSVSASLLLISFFLMKHLGVQPIEAGIYAFLVGYISAGILSLFTVNRLFKVQPFKSQMIRDLALGSFGVFTVDFVLGKTVASESLHMILFFLLIISAGLVFLWKSSQDWVVMVRQRVFIGML